jgi:hypothetical protein
VIEVVGTVIGNTALNNRGTGFIVSPGPEGVGSTLIGNTAANNGGRGFFVNCPSNLTDNTAVNNGQNLVLNGEGCNNTNNLAP